MGSSSPPHVERSRHSEKFIIGTSMESHKEINAGLTDPKIAARIADLASTPFITSPAELDKLVIEYTEKWGQVIRAAGIKPE